MDEKISAGKAIEDYCRRFTEVDETKAEPQCLDHGHLFLAYHAAFPLALTPDLLYNIWAVYRRDVNDQLLDIPWVAVSDLLLSHLCHIIIACFLF